MKPDRLSLLALFSAIEGCVVRFWYRARLPVWAWLLLPLSWIYALMRVIRSAWIGRFCIKQREIPCPLVVVGNLCVGGSGKTPLVVHLVGLLKRWGYRPGVVLRGYQPTLINGHHGIQGYQRIGRCRNRSIRLVDSNTLFSEVGDEALLIERTTGVPVAVSPNRQAAAVVLMRDQGCNIVLSDDGLQRYLLGTPRTIEIIVIDALKRFGNGCLLPVGPLREPLSRLESADFVIQKIPYSDHLDDPDPMGFYLKPVGFVLIEPGIPRQYPLDYFKRYPVVHAYAGIGHPDSFFKTLRDLGLRVIEHPFADHHVYTQEALLLYPGCPIIMTQKDAMRMDPAWEIPNVYYLAVEVHCGSGWIELFQKKIQECFACLS